MRQTLRKSIPVRAQVRTVEDVKQDFFARGEAVTSWATRRRFERQALYCCAEWSVGWTEAWSCRRR